jgi:hypothetical protein
MSCPMDIRLEKVLIWLGGIVNHNRPCQIEYTGIIGGKTWTQNLAKIC